MAVITGASVGFFCLGPYNILGSRSSIEAEAVSVQKERTPLGQAATAHDFVGVERATIQHAGWLDTATGSVVDALLKSNRSRASQLVAIGNEGNTTGVECFCAAGALTGAYKHSVQVEDFTRVDGSMNVSGAIDDRAKILATLTARTDATWATTAVDHGASSSAGLAAYLFVTGLTLGGYDDCDVLVEHSSDGISFATLATFAALTGVGAWRSVIASAVTINRHLRVTASYDGAGTGQSITALVCAERY